MPRDKDLKRLVRGRMKRTGESYTAARSKLLAKTVTRKANAKAKADAAPVKTYAERAGMSDAAVKKATGCTWELWVKALDYQHAVDMPHREIVDLVHRKFKIPGWWAQTVTVGYERIKGLREIGQRRGGSYEATKSKTIAAPLAKVYAAFHEAGKRRRWLPDVDPTVRTATRGKSMRMTWPDETAVDVYFTAKGDKKCQVAVQHRKLPSRVESDRRKAYWADHLEGLARLVAG